MLLDCANIDLGNPVSKHPLNDGLVAWWLPLPNNSGGGKLFDLTGRGNHGTRTNVPTWTLGPSRYAALKFAAASSQYVSVGDPASLRITGDMTVACWVRLTTDAPANGYMLVAKDGDTGGRAYTFDVVSATGNQLRFYINGGTPAGNIVSSASRLTAGVWYHVAGTYSSAGTLKVYINGVLDATATGGSASIPTATAEVRIGARVYSGFEGYADAVIADAMIQNVSLTDAGIASLYDQARRGYPDTLRRWGRRAWSFVVSGGTVEGTGASAGVATVSGVGSSQSAGVGSTTGAATVAGVGAAAAYGVGNAAGLAALAGVGISTAVGVGNAAGLATVAGVNNVALPARGISLTAHDRTRPALTATDRTRPTLTADNA